MTVRGNNNGQNLEVCARCVASVVELAAPKEDDAEAERALARESDAERRRRQLKERKWTIGARLRRPLLLYAVHARAQ